MWIVRLLRKLKWFNTLYHRLFTRMHLIDTRLAPGTWWDTDSRMLYGMMNLLVDYIENEEPFKHIDWDSEERHQHVKKEIEAIYGWWINYDVRQEDIDKALTDWHNEASPKYVECKDKKFTEVKFNHSEKERQLHLKLHDMERKLNLEEELMLIRLIKIRNYLWT